MTSWSRCAIQVAILVGVAACHGDDVPVGPGTARIPRVATADGELASERAALEVLPPADSNGVAGTDDGTGSSDAPPVPQLASLALSIGSTTLVVGAVDSVRVTGFDQYGQQMPVAVDGFASSDPTVLSVSSDGRVAANAAGVAMITATASGLSQSIVVTVRGAVVSAVPVATVSVALNPATIVIGGSALATAVLRDSGGAALIGRAVVWASSAPAIGTVDAAGRVTAVSAGTTTITASSEGQVGQATLTVVAPTIPAASPIPLPALPQQFLDHPYPTVTGRTITVNAGGNLQAALNAAVRGDEIVLEAGATFTGVFTLPAKSGTLANGWVTIRSSRLSQLPVGVRVTPAQAALMPRIVTPDYQAALATALGASGWYIAGVEITVAPDFRDPQNGIVRFGDGSAAQNTLASIASDLVLDRVYLHGQLNTNTKRCLALNSARTTVQHSYLGDCHGVGFDAQAIGGWNGPGPYRIVNNTLAGSAENILFGGADPSVPDLTPSDIEIRRNYVVTPIAWQGVWTKKNLFELKHARRVLIEDNVFDGSWSDGQSGFAFVLKSTNQEGRCRWCATTDVTIRYNIIRNVGGGLNFAGNPETHPVGQPLTRVLVEQNLIENVHVAPYMGDGRMLQLLANVRDIVIRDNTMTGGSGLQHLLSLEASSGTNVELSRTIAALGAFGVKAGGYASGAPSWGVIGGTRVWTGMVLIGSGTNYPTGTTFVPNLAAAATLTGAGVDTAALQARLSGVIIP